MWCLQRLEKELEVLEELKAKREAAEGAKRVMEPVATRKLRKELQKVSTSNQKLGSCPEMLAKGYTSLKLKR